LSAQTGIVWIANRRHGGEAVHRAAQDHDHEAFVGARGLAESESGEGESCGGACATEQMSAVEMHVHLS
jgi:hypothetical protein